jgi:thioredoxin reductase (NADPH)
MATEDLDLVIIGAGPAGLAAAQYGARANLKVLVIEQLAPGGQVLNIDVLENYPGNVGSADRNGPKSGPEFSQDLHRQAEQFGASFLMDSVESLVREGDLFTVHLASGEERRAPALILASGARHRTLDIEGEERLTGRGVSYCATCDGPFFKGKNIFVAGGGDAACDEAQYLSRLSPHVTIVHRRDRFRAQKALAERVLRNPNIKVRFNSKITEIKGDQKVSSVILEDTISGTRSEEETDAVFIFTGMIPQSSLVSGIGAKTDETGYIITDQHMASSVPGLFAAGDVRASPFRQVVVAAGEGAVAAHGAAGYIDQIRGMVY